MTLSRSRHRAAPLLSLLALTGCAGQCGARGGLPPERPPIARGADGRSYYVVEREGYKAFYDRSGRLRRLEHDENGDGLADRVARYGSARLPSALELDQDFDGRMDRWEEYDDAGALVRVGESRRGGAPDRWEVLGPDGAPVRREYDDDGDGRVDRAESLRQGRVVGTELDGDRDGVMDAWQVWQDGRLAAEELDTDGDGARDRRLRYSADGAVLGVEPIARE